MKKGSALLLAAILLLTGCRSSAASTSASAPAEAVKESESSSEALVIYFSRTGEQYVVGVIDKGNTAIAAETMRRTIRRKGGNP